ncbi:MAG: thioredoxin family protein [Chitinophagaceae bacterium]|nr:thioredoxin family protein [Chitinophagaceae bacterium]
MRKGAAILLFFLFSLSLHAQRTATAGEIVSEACRAAERGNKKVFLVFSASWCGWCRVMKRSLEDESCRVLLENQYVIRYLIVDEAEENKHLETPGAGALRDLYGGKDQGIPFWVVMDAKGNVLADSRMIDKNGARGMNTGCPIEAEELEHFRNVLQTTSRLSREEMETIIKRFALNKN